MIGYPEPTVWQYIIEGPMKIIRLWVQLRRGGGKMLARDMKGRLIGYHCSVCKTGEVFSKEEWKRHIAQGCHAVSRGPKRRESETGVLRNEV